MRATVLVYFCKQHDHSCFVLRKAVAFFANTFPEVLFNIEHFSWLKLTEVSIEEVLYAIMYFQVLLYVSLIELGVTVLLSLIVFHLFQLVKLTNWAVLRDWPMFPPLKSIVTSFGMMYQSGNYGHRLCKRQTNINSQKGSFSFQPHRKALVVSVLDPNIGEGRQ